jgi:hypothetical protein
MAEGWRLWRLSYARGGPVRRWCDNPTSPTSASPLHGVDMGSACRHHVRREVLPELMHGHLFGTVASLANPSPSRSRASRS